MRKVKQAKQEKSIFDEMPKTDIYASTDHFRLGIPSIDEDCLRGGLAKGGWVEVYGNPNDGKTTFLKTIGACLQRQHPDKAVVYIDTENKFQPDYARMLGMDVPTGGSSSPKFRYHMIVGLERAMRVVLDYLTPQFAPHISGILIDSLAGLRPARYLDQAKYKLTDKNEFTSKEMALTARIMTDFNPLIVDSLLRLEREDWPVLLYANQVREVTDGSVTQYTRAENRVKTPGGKSKEHYTVQKLFLSKQDKLLQVLGEDAGIRLALRAVRNVGGAPGRADGKNVPFLDIYYSHGGLRRTLTAPTLDEAMRYKIIKKSNSWLEIPDVHKCQGEAQMMEFLMENPTVADELLMLSSEKRRELRASGGFDDDQDEDPEEGVGEDLEEGEPDADFEKGEEKPSPRAKRKMSSIFRRKL